MLAICLSMLESPEDRESFAALYEGCKGRAFYLARRIVGRDDLAEDAVQEAICAAYAGRGSLRDPARFRPWILKILVNKCYEFCRKRRTTVDLADIQDFLPAPAADQAERLSLWQAVMALNSDLRAVVTLFYYEDLSIREISAVLGISEAAVKTRLSRGRSRLKQLLHEE